MPLKKTASAKPTTLEPQQVQHVLEFVEVSKLLDEYKEQHAAVFDGFNTLAEEYNQKLEAAEKTCRSQNISCGPFELYQVSTSYDAKTLFEILGREKFILVGGKISTQTIYEVDKARIEVSIDQKAIAPELIDHFRNVSPKYHKPKKIELP